MKLCNYNWNIMETGYLRYIYLSIDVFEAHDVIDICAGWHNTIYLNLVPERKKARYEFVFSEIKDSPWMLLYTLNVSNKHVAINWIHR
jgi:hypothetical protein